MQRAVFLLHRAHSRQTHVMRLTQPLNSRAGIECVCINLLHYKKGRAVVFVNVFAAAARKKRIILNSRR